MRQRCIGNSFVAPGKSSVYLYTSKAQAQALFQDSDILIDALLGTGLSSTVTGRYAEAIDSINEVGRPVVAVDLPSGLHADTGTILGRAIRASLTVTFGLPKLGLYQSDGINLSGEVAIVDIGIPPAYLEAVESRATLTDTARRYASDLPKTTTVESQRYIRPCRHYCRIA